MCAITLPLIAPTRAIMGRSYGEGGSGPCPRLLRGKVTSCNTDDVK